MMKRKTHAMTAPCATTVSAHFPAFSHTRLFLILFRSTTSSSYQGWVGTLDMVSHYLNSSKKKGPSLREGPSLPMSTEHKPHHPISIQIQIPTTTSIKISIQEERGSQTISTRRKKRQRAFFKSYSCSKRCCCWGWGWAYFNRWAYSKRRAYF